MFLKMLKIKYGKPGSCAKDGFPNRRCQGFKCGTVSKSGWCMGLMSTVVFNGIPAHTLKIAIKPNQCLSTSTFHHELIHMFADMIVKDSDPRHESNIYWPTTCETIECSQESVVNSASWAICKELCGDLCK